MDTLATYLPTDRLHALAAHQDLPERAYGAALFADLSGFTPLTEILVKELGVQRGAEEINRIVNRVFASLIDEVHRYHGSVILFGGDALTCWFNADDGLRAVTCAAAMQAQIRALALVKTQGGQAVTLGMKIAVAVGEVCRLVVGDPQIQLFDVLAGRTLDALAAAEHEASRGEIVLDRHAQEALGGRVEIAAWRTAEHSGEAFAILKSVRVPAQPDPWPVLPAGAVSEAMLRPWVLPDIFERLHSTGTEFLAEIRPAVPVFLYFTGLDYDNDPQAGQKLNHFIQKIEQILAGYEARLLQIIMGDKGSYLYTVFGAPIAHEDDILRGASAALELRSMAQKLGFIADARIGASQGWLFAGSAGSDTRHTYVIMGDEVNLAARLMQAAQPFSILVTARIHRTLGEQFYGQELAPVNVKGKSEPIQVYYLEGIKERATIRLKEPRYALPMVGRAAELESVMAKLELALAGKGQLVGITGEPGVGKSRLVAEVIHQVQQRGVGIYGGECEAFGANTNYLVWRRIGQGLFGLDSSASLERQIEQAAAELARVDRSLLPRLPLLGPLLNLPIPDNDLTRPFDAKLRKTSLEALLVDFLRARCQTQPAVIVLEDCHWLDSLSYDLLMALGRASTSMRLLLVLSYRPPQLERLQRWALADLPNFTQITLGDFTPEEAERLIRLKINQLTGSAENIRPELLERLTARAAGNPFYIEELLNYLKDRSLDPRDPRTLEQIDLPESLHSLILSRIDRISENLKITLKVASIIGRMFKAGWVWGYYPQVGAPQQILENLETLFRADLTPLVPTEPEQTYLFKHVITQEVAYESLPFNTRARLHGLFGRFLEENYSDQVDRYIDLLAFHYDNSDNVEKRRQYLLKAGEIAQANYANAAAIEYYQRALPLVSGPDKVRALLALGQVLELTGRWPEASDTYQQALIQAGEYDDVQGQALVKTALGELCRKQGQFSEATAWLSQARALFDELGDLEGTARVLHFSGTTAAHRAHFDRARDLYEESLKIRRKLGDQAGVAAILSNLGIVARAQGDLQEAARLHSEALAIRRQLGDRWAIGVSLGNLGNIALDQGMYQEARALQEECLAVRRQVGDPWAIANALNNLGNLERSLGNYQEAARLYRESLIINVEMDSKWAIAYLLEDFAALAAACGQAERALTLASAAAALRRATGSPLSPVEQSRLDDLLQAARQALSADEQARAEQTGAALSLSEAVALAQEEE